MAEESESVIVDVSVTEIADGVTLVPESETEKAEAREVVADMDSEKTARICVPEARSVAERRVGAVVSRMIDASALPGADSTFSDKSIPRE